MLPRTLISRTPNTLRLGRRIVQRRWHSRPPSTGTVYMRTTDVGGDIVVRELNGGQCKSYVVACMKSRRAVVVDPVKPNLDRYLSTLGFLNCKLDYTVETHTHADHITASHDLQRIAGAEVVMHNRAPAPYVDVHVKDRDALQVGSLKLDVLHTPGHTPDSISLHAAGRVFTGDALLIGGTGRTDFAGGNAGDSYDSIVNKLFALPDSTIVLPAHDYRGHTESTIGHEKRTNPRLAGVDRAGYIHIMENLGLPLPEHIMEALQTNADAVDDTFDKLPQYTELTSVTMVAPDELSSMLAGHVAGEEDVLVVDVREARELEGDLPPIPGSINLPVRQLPKNYELLTPHKNRHIVCVCRAGVRSATAGALLRGMGFQRVSNLAGGLLEWTSPLNAGDLSAVKEVDPAELRTMMGGSNSKLKPFVLDVREPDEFDGELGHVPGSTLVPLRHVPEQAAHVLHDAARDERPIVVVCRSGRRSARATAALQSLGFRNVFNLAGGMLAFKGCEASH